MADYQSSEVLIIGSGIAGATAALELADADIRVTVVTQATAPEESNTYYAQGGIIYRGKNDSPELLKEDILRAGAGLSNPAAVDVLVQNGPQIVRRILLERAQIEFNKTPGGDFDVATEASHSLARIIHAADATGKAIELGMLRALKEHPKITLITGHTAVDILTPSHHSRDRLAVYDVPKSVGAYLLDQKGDRVVRHLARKTILATGGLGQLFLRTTNSKQARGDGLAMARRAGARLINCEFMQFHPTAFYQEDGPCFLISEAVRGAGARLVNGDGEPFMQLYDAEWKDLAPRDVVARGIHNEMLTHGVPNVFLDLRSNLKTARIRELFPSIYERCLENEVDITKDLVPVVPAAHYFCGGILVDSYGRTTVDDLYAVGEVSCSGVHGSNRLASTSLLEGVVWGVRAAQDVKNTLSKSPPPNPDSIPDWQDTGTAAPDVALIRQDMSSIKHIMWNYVGLVRTQHRLQRALHDLRNLELEIERFYGKTHLTDELIGLRNAVQAALTLAAAAWENKSSQGCHYRSEA